MDGDVYPAIVVVARAGEDLPPTTDVEQTVIDALDGVWGNPIDMVRGVRETTVQWQDEVPPEPPIETTGIIISFGQLPITMYDEGASPFRLVTNALDQKYNDAESARDKQIEMALDATPV